MVLDLTEARRLFLAASGLFLVAVAAPCGGSPTAPDTTPTLGPTQDPAAATSLTFTAAQ